MPGDAPMPVYRLEPIKADDPSWQASSVKDALWVRADLDNSAREKVAHATMTAAKPAGRFASVKLSPWYQSAVTSCQLDHSRTDVPEGAVVRADGRKV